MMRVPCHIVVGFIWLVLALFSAANYGFDTQFWALLILVNIYAAKGLPD